MSRRFPNSTLCETCGFPAATRSDGAARQHTCRMKWDGSPPPWPNMMRASDLAEKIGRTPAWVEGVVNGGPGLRGARLVNAADVGVQGAEATWYERPASTIGRDVRTSFAPTRWDGRAPCWLYPQ